MARAKAPSAATVLAGEALKLRRAACRVPEAAGATLDESAEGLERAAVTVQPHYSKADAAELLEVSRPTLDKWIGSGLLPLEDVPGKARQGIPTAALLALANEVTELRELGQNRGLLAEVLTRLEQEDPSTRWPVKDLQEAASRPFNRDDYVSAMPKPDWGHDD